MACTSYSGSARQADRWSGREHIDFEGPCLISIPPNHIHGFSFQPLIKGEVYRPLNYLDKISNLKHGNFVQIIKGWVQLEVSITFGNIKRLVQKIAQAASNAFWFFDNFCGVGQIYPFRINVFQYSLLNLSQLRNMPFTKISRNSHLLQKLSQNLLFMLYCNEDSDVICYNCILIQTELSLITLL